MLLKRDSQTKKWGNGKKILHAKKYPKKWKPKKSGVAILIKDKLGFEKDPITKDKERYYILIKGSM